MRTERSLIYLVDFLLGVVELILALRLLLRLFGANPASPFTLFSYQLSAPFLAPFANIFPSVTFGSNFVLEFTTLFAMIIYAIIGYLLVELIEFLMHGSRRTVVHIDERHLP